MTKGPISCFAAVTILVEFSGVCARLVCRSGWIFMLFFLAASRGLQHAVDQSLGGMEER